MLKFQLGEYILDLPNQVSVDFDFSQAAFFDDIIKGSGSYDITFPLSPTNNKAFGFVNQIHANMGVRLFDVLVHFGANTIVNGVLSLWESSEDGYVATVEKSEIPFLANSLSIKALAWEDVVMGTTTTEVIAYAKNAANRYDHNYPVRFPQIAAPMWYGNDQQNNPFFKGTVNGYDPIAAAYRKNVISELYLENNLYSLVPCVTYYAILKQIASQFGYSIVGTALISPEILNMSFLNNHSLDELGESYPQRDSGSWGIAADAGTPEVGTHLSTPYTPQQYGTHRITISGNHLIEVTNVLIKLCKDVAGDDTWLAAIGSHGGLGEINLTFDYYVPDLTPFYVCAYKSNDLDPDPVLNVSVTVENIGWNHLNIFAKNIHIPNHLPEMSVSEFLVMYKKQACLNIDFDKENSLINFNLREDLLKSEIKELSNINPRSIRKLYNKFISYEFKWANSSEFTFTSDKFEGEFDSFWLLPTANDVNQYAFIKTDQAWWKVEYDEDTNKYSWQWHTDFVPSYKIGDSDLTTVDMGASLVPMMHFDGRICIRQDNNGVSPLNKDAELSDDIMVFLYQGLLSDGPWSHPTGSSNGWDYNGDYRKSLQFDGANGLFIWRLKEWYEAMLSSDEVEMEVILKGNEISDLFIKRIYFKGIMLLLSEMDLSISEMNILPSNMTFRRIL